MSNIYTSIELGTNSIKVVVMEKINEHYNTLASGTSPSFGIRNGQIEDIKLAAASVKKAIKAVYDMIGIKVSKVIVCVPPTNCKFDIATGSSTVMNPKNITGEDVSNVFNNALNDIELSGNELITAMPISFVIDGNESTSDPKGLSGEEIEAKIVVASIPKEELGRYLQVLKVAGVVPVDVTFTSIGDYFAVKNRRLDNIVGAVINIGESVTNVSVFNKGIQIKNSVISIGSRNVDKDISYVFKIDDEISRRLKETYAICMSNYADSNDVIDLKNSSGEMKQISQMGISKVVESRVSEILKLAKNDIKNLTNREISYIIITGGLSEQAGFGYLVEEEFGAMAKVCNLTSMGLRHNKFSSCVGAIKYFDEKLALRGKCYDMIESEELENAISSQNKLINNDNIISKVFAHFFDS